MAINNKLANVANFNCTFGESHEPMLNYFTEVIFPALTSKNDQDKKGLIFDNVNLKNLNGKFVLTGLIIKRTKLEVKSLYSEGEIKRTNEVYPSDPYSYFIINLENHRMVLVKNQRGSPTLANFSDKSRKKIKQYITEKNKEKNETEKIPNVHLNIVAIPFQGTIQQEFERIQKIKQVILRFYPLNGDIIDNETTADLLDVLDKLGSNTGNVRYNTPDNKENVAKMIEDTKGLMKPTMNVEFKNGSTGTLKDGAFAERIEIPLDETKSIAENLKDVSGKMLNRDEFTETSEENKNIYDRFYTILEETYYKIRGKN